jgi:hypothetical protein
MEGFYTKLLKQAYRLAKGYKFFWTAGLFLVWPVLVRSLFLFMVVAASIWPPRTEFWPVDQSTATQGNLWSGIIGLVVIIFLALQYSKYKAGTIIAVNQLQRQTTISIEEVLKQAKAHVYPLLKISLVFLLGVAAMLTLLTGPVMHLLSTGYSSRAIILGSIAAGIFLPIFLTFYYGSIFVPLFKVAQGLSTSDSIRVTYDLVRKRFPILLFFSILLLAFELVVFTFASTIWVGVTSIFVLLIPIFYDMGGDVLVGVLSGLGVTLGFVVFFMSQAMIAAYQRIAWTIMFFEIVKPSRLPEAVLEPDTIPEEVIT